MRIFGPLGLACSITVAGCAAKPPPSTAPIGAPSVEPFVPDDAPPEDDSRLHHHRNYFALEYVGPDAHHFTAWWPEVGPSHCDAAVVDGEVSLTGCVGGGLSDPPRDIPDVPASVSAEAKLVESAVRARSAHGSEVRIRYDGTYRKVVLSEIIITTSKEAMGKPVGWQSRVYWKADPSLTRIEGIAAGRSLGSTWGMIDVAGEAARVSFVLPPSLDGRRLVTSDLIRASGIKPDAARHERELVEHVLAVARERARGTPVPTISELYSSPVDTPSVSATLDQPLALVLSLYARHQNFRAQKHVDLVLRLHPRLAALEGKTLAVGEARIDGIHVKASATMTALTPSTAPPGSSLSGQGRELETTITLQVSDDRGNVIDRSYPARGRVVGEPPALAIPAGLALRSKSSSSNEADALRWTWNGNGQATSFDFYVSPELAPMQQ